jgi:hypothetical protein
MINHNLNNNLKSHIIIKGTQKKKKKKKKITRKTFEITLIHNRYF